MGYPVVLKIMSPDILHKSDAGGVKVNLRNADEVRLAYRTILANARAYKADARLDGVAVQQMAPAGLEVILGSINDPTFGPTVMFGLGGIFIEILKDVTFRVAPISAEQARAMLADIQARRSSPARAAKSPRPRRLAEALSRYSQMITTWAMRSPNRTRIRDGVHRRTGVEGGRCADYFEVDRDMNNTKSAGILRRFL
jgi:acetyltransferase